MRIGPFTANLALLLTLAISGGTSLAQIGAPGYQGPAQAVYMRQAVSRIRTLTAETIPA